MEVMEFPAVLANMQPLGCSGGVGKKLKIIALKQRSGVVGYGSYVCDKPDCYWCLFMGEKQPPVGNEKIRRLPFILSGYAANRGGGKKCKIKNQVALPVK